MSAEFGEQKEVVLKRPQPVMEGIARRGFEVRGGSLDEDSVDENAEILGNRALALETDAVRNHMQVQFHGKTDEELEKAADEFLKANGSEDLAKGF